MFLALGVDLPFHVEPGFRIDRAVLRGQIAHMAVGGEDRVVVPEIGVDRLCLGRGLDNNNGHDSSPRRACRLALPQQIGGFRAGSSPWPSIAPAALPGRGAPAREWAAGEALSTAMAPIGGSSGGGEGVNPRAEA